MAITWLPNASDPRKFGTDQSRHQGFTDYGVMAQAAIPPLYGAARTSISWGYTDPLAEHHLKGYASIGIDKRMGYHILYPWEDAQRQVDRAVKAVVDAGIDPALIVPIEDAELDHGASPLTITKKIEQMIVRYELSDYKQMPVIYTRPKWVQEHMLPFADWYEEVIWWMAAYTFTGQESSEALIIKNMELYCPGIPLENCLFVQTSEKGKGAVYGAKSEKLDYDRFRGTDQQWSDFWNIEQPPPPPPGPEPVPVKVTVPAGQAVVTVEEVT